MDTYDWQLQYDGTPTDVGQVHAEGRDAALEAAAEACGWSGLTSDPGSLWQLIVQARGHHSAPDAWVSYEPAVLSR